MTKTNPFGKVSELSLVVAPGKMRHLSFTAPLKVLHSSRQDGFLQIMVVKVSAGLMAGDRQSIKRIFASRCSQMAVRCSSHCKHASRISCAAHDEGLLASGYRWCIIRKNVFY